MGKLIGAQAVVVGAGLAGLSAARAVADYFMDPIPLEPRFQEIERKLKFPG